jgi:hypothetical protein
LRIRNTATSGFVIADAARWVSTSASNATLVQLIATDPIAAEGGNPAKILVSRSFATTNSTLTVFYTLSGTASNGVDFASLPGNLLLPAGIAATNFSINAIDDAVPEGDKMVAISLQPGTNYGIGAWSNATVKILDTPFDGWRFAYFTALELTQPNISGPAADPDLDGANNLHEYLAGTDPRDVQSVLRLKINVPTDTAHLSFSAGTNRSYTLQYLHDLATGSWLDLTNYLPAPTNRTLNYAEGLAGASNRFYRVLAQ